MYVFVYGTLKPGGRYHQSFCQDKCLAAEAAKVKGTLYDLALDYPAMQEAIHPESEGWVYGTLLHFESSQVLIALDRLEVYDVTQSPDNNEYQRIRCDCFTLSGAFIARVWTYVMEAEQLARYPYRLIPSGNWPVGRIRPAK